MRADAPPLPAPPTVRGRRAAVASGLRAAWAVGAWRAGAALSWPLPLRAEAAPMEAHAHPAWAGLRQRFQALARDPGAAPVRILHLGDSHTAAPAFSGRLRELIRRRFDDSGPGPLPLGELPGHPQEHLDLRQSDGWVSMRERQPDAAASGAPEGALGGFAAYGQRPFQWVSYRLQDSPRAAGLILYADPEDLAHASRFKVFHDRKELFPVTRSPGGRSFYMLPAGNGRLKILSRVGGDMPRLRGLSLLRQIPGVSYCAIGVNGAGFGILREWRGATARMQMSDYQPDLLILAFGTNDVVAAASSRDAFERTLQRTEAWIGEQAPWSAVLMVLPPGLPRHEARVQDNLRVLREVVRGHARKKGWFIWDWSRALHGADASGLGADGLWARDGIHLTPRGYSHSADRLVEALGVVFD